MIDSTDLLGKCEHEDGHQVTHRSLDVEPTDLCRGSSLILSLREEEEGTEQCFAKNPKGGKSRSEDIWRGGGGGGGGGACV